jgi:lysine N6-hydroxylase
VRQFHRLPEARKPSIVQSQKLAGDGVSPRTLSDLSQRLYEEDFLKAKGIGYAILPYRDVRAMTREHGAYTLEMHNGFDQSDEVLSADLVILATGYSYVLPPCLASMKSAIRRDEDGNIKLAEDYSISWGGPPTRRIYMQNAGRQSHGIADPQLSLTAWRSAVIVNSLLGREVFPTNPAPTPIRWSHATEAVRVTSTREAQPPHVAVIPT